MQQRSRGRGCEDCPGRSLQSDDGDECIQVGSQDGDKPGETFMGKTVGGRRQGKGEYRWSNGNRYVGDFRDGSASGQGRLMMPDGTTIEGMFERGEVNGWATKQFGNGDRYEGDFADGLEHG